MPGTDDTEVKVGLLRFSSAQFSYFTREGGGGGLLNKGRFGCSASTKRISPKNLMPGQKSTQKPDDRASFREL